MPGGICAFGGRKCYPALLAVKLNVVRQTVSKWGQGLSVPDKANLRTA